MITVGNRDLVAVMKDLEMQRIERERCIQFCNHNKSSIIRKMNIHHFSGITRDVVVDF